MEREREKEGLSAQNAATKKERRSLAGWTVEADKQSRATEESLQQS